MGQAVTVEIVIRVITLLAAAVAVAAAWSARAAVLRLRTHRERSPVSALNCPSPDCNAQRRTGQYLCWDCWDALPAPTRRALSIRDDLATARVQILHRELAAGVPPQEIRIDL
ncbi:hypothetical protein ABTX60_06825 [Streptomyces sp. NPDC126510]|uniref:hypothetical protein n=1 Tax=Streptomyces sp. NPDC126510 TaxID=3155317 RepID=UPI00332D972F